MTQQPESTPSMDEIDREEQKRISYTRDLNETGRDAVIDESSYLVKREVDKMFLLEEPLRERLSLKGVTVLNADDNEDIIRANKRAFERLHAVCIFVDNGEKALALYADLPEGSVVILDNDMGFGLRGIDVAREIRSHRPDLLIYMTSGDINLDIQDALIVEGVITASFPKPYNYKDIVRDIICRKRR